MTVIVRLQAHDDGGGGGGVRVVMVARGLRGQCWWLQSVCLSIFLLLLVLLQQASDRVFWLERLGYVVGLSKSNSTDISGTKDVLVASLRAALCGWAIRLGIAESQVVQNTTASVSNR